MTEKSSLGGRGMRAAGKQMSEENAMDSTLMAVKDATHQKPFQEQLEVLQAVRMGIIFPTGVTVEQKLDGNCEGQ